MRHPGNAYRDDALLIFVVLVWGANFPILKQALSVMHPFVLNVFRFIFSLLFLGSILIFSRQQRSYFTWETVRQHSRTILGLGMLGYVVYQVFFLMGIDRTTAGNSALIMASAPAWTAFFAFLLSLERLKKMAWIGLSVSVVGTMIIALGPGSDISLEIDYFWGNMLTVGAAACWGAYTAFSKPVTRHLHPLVLTFCGIVVAMPLISLIALPYFEQIVWSNVTLWVWAAIIYSGGLSTGIAVLLWTQAVKRLGATYTAVFGNLVPLVALLGGAFLLNETISMKQIVGGACIIGGLILMRRDRQKNG